MFEFEVLHRSGRSRVARFHTPHGTITTPMFMPVGTQGSVKGISPLELKEIGSQMILANTYHLMLRPGEALVQQHGGLQGFTAYAGPFLTDSGGYQVMSLGQMRKISEAGVIFKSHIDGSKVELSPEKAIQVQEALGADVIMAFDECPPHPTTPEYLTNSLERTLRWLERCVRAKTRADQALFAIVQGGIDPVLRRRSLEGTLPFATPGFAIGGLAVGESKLEMYPAVDFTVQHLPENKPRYLMGVGHPDDLVIAVGLGVDMFDCVDPTRIGRHGQVHTDTGRLNMNNAKHRASMEPLSRDCDCYACTHYTRAYLAHLYRAGEMLAQRMFSLHNLRYLHRLMERARSAIAQNCYLEWATDWGMTFYNGQLPEGFAAALELF